MEPKRSEGRRDAGRPLSTLYYRDYIISSAWEVRKAQYYQRYAKACKICGDTDRVELNHIKYGNYGQEKDKDLVPLCRTHHGALHAKIGVRKDMHYQTEYFLADMIAEWDTEHEISSSSTVPSANVPIERGTPTLVVVLDKLARPIWKLLALVLRR